jgi:hypothetical protein
MHRNCNIHLTNKKIRKSVRNVEAAKLSLMQHSVQTGCDKDEHVSIMLFTDFLWFFLVLSFLSCR